MMNDRSTVTPSQVARLDAWIEEMHAIAQLGQEALADLVEQELSGALDLTSRQYTILEEVQDRLRGLPRVVKDRSQEAPN
jgi:hypothetical protein